MHTESRAEPPPEAQPCACVVDLPKHKGGRIFIERCALHEAAPKLLEALEGILDWVAPMTLPRRLTDPARAAIKKARGS